MNCDICGKTGTKNFRAKLTVCDKCYSLLSKLQDNDPEAISFFQDEETIKNASQLGKNYISETVGKHVDAYSELKKEQEAHAEEFKKEQEALAEELREKGILYRLQGARGRKLDVYEDKCVITVTAGIEAFKKGGDAALGAIGAIITGNSTDGEKTIYYSDCIGIQFKEPGVTIGYLQLETAAATMNNKASNFFNENSFTWDTTQVSLETMREVADYIKKRIDEIKRGVNTTPEAGKTSVADEILKFKQLLDMGAITEEEFNEQKQKLLNS